MMNGKDEAAVKVPTADDIRSLVQPNRVHRRAYADSAVFELEMERMFSRLWIYVAHDSQLRKPGDFVRTRLADHGAGDAQRDGRINAAQPVPHRGARLA